MKTEGAFFEALYTDSNLLSLREKALQSRTELHKNAMLSDEAVLDETKRLSKDFFSILINITSEVAAIFLTTLFTDLDFLPSDAIPAINLTKQASTSYVNFQETYRLAEAEHKYFDAFIDLFKISCATTFRKNISITYRFFVKLIPFPSIPFYVLYFVYRADATIERLLGHTPKSNSSCFYTWIQNVLEESQYIDLPGQARSRRAGIANERIQFLSLQSHVPEPAKAAFPTEEFLLDTMKKAWIPIYLHWKYFQACTTFLQPMNTLTLAEQEAKANDAWQDLLRELDQEEEFQQEEEEKEEEEIKEKSSSSQRAVVDKKSPDRIPAKSIAASSSSSSSSTSSSSSSSSTAPTLDTSSPLFDFSTLIDAIGTIWKINAATDLEKLTGRRCRLGNAYLHFQTCLTILYDIGRTTSADCLRSSNAQLNLAGDQTLEALFGFVVLEKWAATGSRTAWPKLSHDIGILAKLYGIKLPDTFWTRHTNTSLTARYAGRYPKPPSETDISKECCMNKFVELINLIALIWGRHQPEDSTALKRIQEQTEKVVGSYKTAIESASHTPISVDEHSRTTLVGLREVIVPKITEIVAATQNLKRQTEAFLKEKHSHPLSILFVQTQLQNMEHLANFFSTLSDPSDYISWSLFFSDILIPAHYIAENSMVLCGKKYGLFHINHQFSSQHYELEGELSSRALKTLDMLGTMGTAEFHPITFVAKWNSCNIQQPLPSALRLFLDLHYASRNFFTWNGTVVPKEVEGLRTRMLSMVEDLLITTHELVTKTLPRVLAVS